MRIELFDSKRELGEAAAREAAGLVRDCLESEVSPRHPASALRTHGGASLYLDRESASLLTTNTARES